MPKIPGVNKNNIKTKRKKIYIYIMQSQFPNRSNPISNKNKTMRNEINIPFSCMDVMVTCEGMRRAMQWQPRVIAAVQRPLHWRTIYWLSINGTMSSTVIFPSSVRTPILPVYVLTHCDSASYAQNRALVECSSFTP